VSNKLKMRVMKKALSAVLFLFCILIFGYYKEKQYDKEQELEGYAFMNDIKLFCVYDTFNRKKHLTFDEAIQLFILKKK
jgi:hypothetical protein